PGTHAGDMSQIELPWSVHGSVETPIYAKLAGYLKTINVDKGDRVEQGQLLAVIDAPEVDKQVADMEADYAIKARNYRRRQKLVDTGALSHEELDTAQAESAKSPALFEQTRALQADHRRNAPVSRLMTARET